MSLQTWELLSYIVTVIGLPAAILIFIYEQRRERENEDEEIYLLLSDAYTDFLKLIIANPDLKLHTQTSANLTEEQHERVIAIFDLLVSLFERAYLLAYEEKMSAKQLRRWRSWDDFMREWCRRDDFRAELPRLLVGEDPDFASYIRSLAHQEGKGAAKT